MNYLNLIILLLLSILISCNGNKKKKEFTQLVTEWQGKEIQFSENTIFTRYLTDTTDFRIPESDYKVLVYVDSIGCTSCKLQLNKWKKLIEYTDSVTQQQVPFLFFFHAKDYKEIRYLLRRDDFDRPVCIDIDNSLNKLNHFPSDMTFQTFLLDKNNKVAVLGNPVHNPAIKELYLKHITGKGNPSKKILLTTAEANQTEIDFGTFDKSEIKEATIEIKNSGDNSLVIVNVGTTCGCTAATYDKHPAKPREILRVKIKMTPKDTGFFTEVVNIKCNSINNRPIKVKIKGHVR